MSKKRTAKKQPKQRVCIIKGCGKTRSARGLCTGCYVAAQRVIELGEESWPSLVKKGLALPVGSVGRPRSSPFSIALTNLNNLSSEQTAK